MSSSSHLEQRLASGAFVVTAEIAPPRGTDTGNSLALAGRLAPLVDAFNVTDNQNARLRLSPLAFAHLLGEQGLETVYQITCRDRNRLALQADLLGAWALGLKNVLALTGDFVSLGDHPDAKAVFDLDAVQLLETIRKLNGGGDLAGKRLKGSPAFFSGAALACEQKPPALARQRFRKKIQAGARFFQTQALFNAEPLRPFMDIASAEGVFILAGILLLHSPGMIAYINAKVPGLHIPEEVSRRIISAANPAEAGLDEAARLISEISSCSHGVHIMTAGRDDLIPELIGRSGLPPRYI